MIQLFANEIIAQQLPYAMFDPSPSEIELNDFYGRSLSHKSDPDVLDGKNLKLRAKRDKKGICIKYQESQI